MGFLRLSVVPILCLLYCVGGAIVGQMRIKGVWRCVLIWLLCVCSPSLCAQMQPPAQGDLTVWPPPANIWPISVRNVGAPNVQQQASIDDAIGLICDLAKNLDTTMGSPAEQRDKRRCKKLLKEACDKYSKADGEPPDVFLGDLTGADALTMPNSRDGDDSKFAPGDTGNLIALDRGDPATGDLSGMDSNGDIVYAERDHATGQVTQKKLDPSHSRWYVAMLLFHEFGHCVQGLRGDSSPIEVCYGHWWHAYIYKKQVDVAPSMPTPAQGGVPLGDWVSGGRACGLTFPTEWERKGRKAQDEANRLGWPVHVF